jgi:hypothetical protein
MFQAFDLSGANRLETCCSFDRIVRWINAGHVSNASCLKNIFPIAPSYHAPVQHRPPASKQLAFLVELFQKAFLAS